MDLFMPKKNGIDATTEILDASPATKILILTSFGTSDGIARSLQAGAVGAFMKTADDGALVSAIRKVMHGERVISPEVRRMLNEDPPVPELSSRQREILNAIATGLTNKEIAATISVRKDTVEDYLRMLRAVRFSSRLHFSYLFIWVSISVYVFFFRLFPLIYYDKVLSIVSLHINHIIK